ncbi:hypothetical protein [Pseudomonas oryzihabitans]|uniref:hypothetical protein n=1 Tax=Pseudomonas oryzihabitans TaxID=47885 RepID=UPI001123D9DE|nr:hypothetical protein [Pseudomonas psychrotolerans]QDD91909.1 hypothetical protein CCZ28_24005 [Pseudomonas psychrotolerans]
MAEEGGKDKSFPELISENLGSLFIMSTMQLRTIMLLSKALKNEPNVSEETHKLADESLARVDEMIEYLDKSIKNISEADIKQFFKDRS